MDLPNVREGPAPQMEAYGVHCFWEMWGGCKPILQKKEGVSRIPPVCLPRHANCLTKA